MRNISILGAAIHAALSYVSTQVAVLAIHVLFGTPPEEAALTVVQLLGIVYFMVTDEDKK